MTCLFDLPGILAPVWCGDVLSCESLLFTPDAVTGAILPCRLLCKPGEILRVCSADLQTEYVPELDYLVDGQRIIRTPASRMPAFSKDEFFPASPAAIPIASESCAGRYVRYEPDGKEVLRRQVFISYRHETPCPLSPPEVQLSRLSHTASALREKKPLTLLFYGDSFVEGCDASGKSGLAPYLPTFDRLVSMILAQSYRHPQLRRVNTALGGTSSQWGAEHAGARLAAHRPDLAIIRFGMNDSGAGISPESFYENILAIIRAGRAQNPQMEVLLLSPETPNPDCKGWIGLQRAYEAPLRALCDELPGCAIVCMGALCDAAVAAKGYASLSANLVNHPNDFMIRIYAAAVAWALGAAVRPTDHFGVNCCDFSHLLDVSRQNMS